MALEMLFLPWDIVLRYGTAADEMEINFKVNK